MNNVGEKYLPLGSVVMLKGASKRLMITGFCTMAAEDESGVMYDYSGCMYPEGVISSDQTALFNHDQIEKVYHMGLIDEEENTFKAKLVQLVNSQNVVSESAPQTIREQEGVAPVVQPEPQAVAPVQPVEVPVPPIGPGLPGYVAPVVSAPVESNGFQFDSNGNVVSAPIAQQTPVQPVEVPVPPIGPGLPGYVAPVAPVAQPAAAITVESNGFQFDANGNVIAAPQVQEVPQAQPQSVQSFSNIQFDENGTVVSA